MLASRMARTDEGFSVAEVVIAAAILFFVLTAMVGLIGASQNMGVMAKDKTTLTNAMAEHIDHIRAMDYATIGSPPSGLVPLSEETTYGAYTIRFTNRVVMPDGANGEYLRTVYVKASCSIRGHLYKTSATIHIRNPKNDTTAASITDPDAPALEFTSGTTPENAIIYDNAVYPSGTAIRLETRATSSDDVVTQVKYLVGGVLVRDGAGMLGDEADFPVSPGEATVDTGTYWDTRQTGVIEGLETVVVQALDSRSRYSTVQRQFVVDNVAPGAVLDLGQRQVNSTESKVIFKAAADPPVSGTEVPSTYAASYPMTIRREPEIGGARYTWPAVVTTTVTPGLSYLDAIFNPGPFYSTVSTTPFSRYYVRVTAKSPRGLTGPVSRAYFVSPPDAVSTGANTSTCATDYVKSGNTTYTTYAVNMWINKPTFPITSGETTFKLMAKNAAGTAWSEVTPVGPVSAVEVGEFWKLTFTYKTASAAENLWFKIGVNVTPVGEAASGFVFSNAIGTSPIDTNKNSGTPVTAQINPDLTWAK